MKWIDQYITILGNEIETRYVQSVQNRKPIYIIIYICVTIKYIFIPYEKYKIEL